MKIKPALAALMMAGIMGCQEPGKGPEQHQHPNDSVTHNHSQITGSKLTLNDGHKWKLDTATRTNMATVKHTVQKASAVEHRDYAKLAADLEANTGNLVSQCKMSGKDHDMLHVWLEDFLGALKQLKDPAHHEHAFQKIEGQVKEFDAYFE